LTAAPGARPSLAVAAGVVPLLAILTGLEIGLSFFAPLLPQMQREFGISAGVVALALAMYNGIRLAFNLPMSRVIARSRLPAMLATGGAILAAGAIVVGLAPSFAVLLLGRAIMGLGSALFILTVHFWLARLATPENRAQLFSYHQLVGLTGSALGPALGGLVAGWLSWRYALGLAVIPGVIAALAGGRLPYPVASAAAAPASTAPLAPGRDRAAASGGPRADRVATREILSAGMSMASFMFFHGGIVMTLIPLFSARRIGLGPEGIGAILMLGTLQRFGAALTGGWLVRRFGTRRVVMIGLAVLALSVLSFLTVHSTAGLVLAVSLVSWANLGGSFVIAMLTDRVPEDRWGTALGANRTMGDVGATVAPILLGFVIDRWGFEVAFASATGVMLVSAGLATVLTASRGRASA
jgi:predicted MFS family arabinose efflux permease